MSEISPQVYKLEMFPDGPLSEEGFAFVNDASVTGRDNIFEDFMPLDPTDRNWQAPRLAECWNPREVEGYANPDNDFPWVGMDIPGFRQRAVDGLRDFLESNGELLALKTPPGVGTCWAYNITTIADVLDEQRSELELYPGSSFAARRITQHEFVPGRLPSLSIFRIPNSTLDVFATDRFVDRVRRLNLQGLRAVKVWPLSPETESYELAEEKPSRKRAGTTPPAAPVAMDPKYTSRPPSGQELKSLKQAIAQYPDQLKLNAPKMTPQELQKSIYQTLEKLRSSERDIGKLKDRAFWLGIAWGEALVRELAWEWAMVEDEKKKAASIAVVSPDRSLAVLPVLFMERIATNPGADSTSQLLFNMIRAGKVPKAAPGSLKLLW